MIPFICPVIPEDVVHDVGVANRERTNRQRLLEGSGILVNHQTGAVGAGCLKKRPRGGGGGVLSHRVIDQDQIGCILDRHRPALSRRDVIDDQVVDHPYGVGPNLKDRHSAPVLIGNIPLNPVTVYLHGARAG